MALKGRHWLGLWLLAALAALSLVIWRQTDGLRAARALAEARERHASLEGTRSELQRRIRAPPRPTPAGRAPRAPPPGRAGATPAGGAPRRGGGPAPPPPGAPGG